MNASMWIALWGAVLSTGLATLQFLTWLRARPRIKVDCNLEFMTSSGDDENEAKGTIVPVIHDRDVYQEEVLVRFHITNHGDKGVQIVAVVLEAIAEQYIHTNEITPDPLPTILEPFTSIDMTIQKEFIDMELAITFLGVVDALGRRQSVPDVQCRDVVTKCWDMPTRVGWFVRRDDPEAPPVRAFQSKDKFRLSSRVVTSLPKRKRRPLISRTKFEPPRQNLQPSASPNSSEQEDGS